MKNIKKIISVLLTFVLMVLTVTNVKADNTGSIVVSGTTNGKTYDIYRIFKLTYSGDNVAYTIDSDWVDFFTGDGAKYIVSDDTDPSSLSPITVGSSTKYINITDSNIVEFTQDALAYASSLPENKIVASKDATGETTTFDNLELGYYLVYPKGAADKVAENGSICSITSTLPTAQVSVKATYPTITKEVDDQNVEVGQTVNFTITGKVPDTTGFDSYTYTISDTMTAGLQLNQDVVVKFGTETIATTPAYNGNGFTITFNMVDYQQYVGKVITVTYTALITEDAVVNDETVNTATLNYSNDPRDSESFGEVTVEVPVYSSEIKITKTDAKDGQTLAGAKFVIKNSEGKYYAAYNANGLITNLSTTEGLVNVDWVDDIEDATVLVTGDDGIILFKGIENAEYLLEEVEAPAGYNKLTGPVTVNVGSTEEGGVTYMETVENNSGTELPSTGGVGTTLFIVMGTLLALASALILITNKRMSNNEF